MLNKKVAEKYISVPTEQYREMICDQLMLDQIESVLCSADKGYNPEKDKLEKIIAIMQMQERKCLNETAKETD